MKRTKLGRPPKNTEAMMNPITLRLPEAMSSIISTIQAERIDAPDKATVIRELLAIGIKARKKK